MIRARHRGTHTARQWAIVKWLHQGMCSQCLRVDRKLTKDHIKPISIGGSDDIMNLQPMCGPCNSQRKPRERLDLRGSALREQIFVMTRENHVSGRGPARFRRLTYSLGPLLTEAITRRGG